MRFYTSVSAFSADFGAVFSAAIGLPEPADTAEVQAHITNESSAKDSTTEYKEKKKLAKRIIKAVQGSLEDAMRKESELCRKPFEKELRDLDLILENSFLSRRHSLANSLVGGASETEIDDRKLSAHVGVESYVNGRPESPPKTMVSDEYIIENSNNTTVDTAINGIHSTSMVNGPITGQHSELDSDMAGSESKKAFTVPHQLTPEELHTTPLMNGNNNHEIKNRVTSDLPLIDVDGKHLEPLTPPLSSEGDSHPFLGGGIPWYMVPFDPVGTTIEEERWTGRDLVRGMSEELSDMDEEELSGLVSLDSGETVSSAADGTLHPESAAGNENRRKNGAKRKRWRGFR